jgi:hypothetical protein
MPMYFFHLTNGTTVENMDGENFDIQAEAYRHAVRIARELARRGAAPSMSKKFVSEINEHGVIVFKTPLPEAE